jgi:hypothetical protein
LRRDCNGIGPGEVAGWWRCVPHDVAAPEVITMVPNAVVLNPRTDPDFVTFAESVLAEGPVTPEAFEARLRERYPSAVVRPRELASEPLTLWYCYRDGTWTRPW